MDIGFSFHNFINESYNNKLHLKVYYKTLKFRINYILNNDWEFEIKSCEFEYPFRCKLLIASLSELQITYQDNTLVNFENLDNYVKVLLNYMTYEFIKLEHNL